MTVTSSLIRSGTPHVTDLTRVRSSTAASPSSCVGLNDSVDPLGTLVVPMVPMDDGECTRATTAVGFGGDRASEEEAAAGLKQPREMEAEPEGMEVRVLDAWEVEVDGRHEGEVAVVRLGHRLGPIQAAVVGLEHRDDLQGDEEQDGLLRELGQPRLIPSGERPEP